MNAKFRAVLAVIFAVLYMGDGVAQEKAMNRNLHFTADRHIGDVHPFYNAQTEQWYLYYLMSGGYDSSLLISDDLLHWEKKELSYEGTKLTNYYSVAVVPKDGAYYTWYGASTTLDASASHDLLTWRAAPSGYQIHMDTAMYPAGARDPYVFFDEDAQVYRMLCLAYKTNQLRGRGLGMHCMIAHAQTRSASLDDWGLVDTTVIAYEKGMLGEPECPQAMKIGSRWYVFTSRFDRMKGYPGRLSYYVGDENTEFLTQDWQGKEEHYLTGEHLFAAQLAADGEKVYMWGWITPYWDKKIWAGDLSLPYRVYQGADGLLYTRLDENVGQMIRGAQLCKTQTGAAMAAHTLTRYDMEISLSIPEGRRVQITLDCANIILDAQKGLFSIMRTGEEAYVTHAISPERLRGAHTLRLIGEGDILEAFLDDAWSLCARLQNTAETAGVTATGANHADIIVYELKTLPEK